MRWMKLCGAVLLTLAAHAVQAAAPVFQEGRDYRTLHPALAVEAPKGRIEVLAYFSYASPACLQTEARLGEWLKRLPGDVSFRRVPVIASRDGTEAARLYLALEVTNQVGLLHAALFQAIGVQHLPLLRDEKALLDWVAQRGGNAGALRDARRSFKVQHQLEHLTQTQGGLGLGESPALAVAGRFMTGDSFFDKLMLTDYLIAKARSQQPHPAGRGKA